MIPISLVMLPGMATGHFEYVRFFALGYELKKTNIHTLKTLAPFIAYVTLPFL